MLMHMAIQLREFAIVYYYFWKLVPHVASPRVFNLMKCVFFLIVYYYFWKLVPHD